MKVTPCVIAASSLLTAFAPPARAANVQGTCAADDPGLQYLSHHLSPNATLSCFGQPLQEQNAARYWGVQYSKNASAVVYPASKDDVSVVMEALPLTPLGQEFAFVSGGHSTANASSASRLVMDLSSMRTVQILDDFDIGNGNTTTTIRYDGGCVWKDVYSFTAGSGWTAVGARDSSVGVGGFSTGGGIGFLAGAYGYATDRLVALDVVLLNGTQIRVNNYNEYHDLFFAFRGGTGQFGVITTFYQKAAPEPTSSEISFYYIQDDQVDLAQQNVLQFYRENTDPFSLIYYAPDYIGPSFSEITTDQEIRVLLFALRFNDPLNDAQPDFNTTFAPLLKGLNTSNSVSLDQPFAQAADIAGPFYSYGLRRGFWGPQLPTNGLTTDYLDSLTEIMRDYTNALIASGDNATSTSFVLQYQYPGLNGNLPRNGDDTAWPHASAGHQTLFTPGYTLAKNDQLAVETNNRLNELAWNLQRDAGVELADYPNYMGPGVAGSRLYGDNLKALEAIKEKYDPECFLHQGRVFASPGCVKKGYANLFEDGLGAVMGPGEAS
ncbi:MAG: hypothetical protein Q9159_001627 [Coniocarpon cinnabarinum]